MLSESQKKFAEERKSAGEAKKEEENRLYLKKTEESFKVTRPFRRVHL